MMPITGDFARLQATVRGLRKLADIPSQVAPAVSVAIKAEIDASFDSTRDPYGKQWAPHKPATAKRRGKHPLLQLTGAGRAAITVRPAPGAGVIVSSPSEGLAFAQGGTRYEVARRFLPTDTFPKSWRLAIEKAVEARVKEALNGAR